MKLTRLGGATLLVGSVATICAAVLGAVAGDVAATGALTVTAALIEAVAGILVLLGLPAMLAGQGDRARRLTLPGYVGIFAVVAFFHVFLSLVIVTFVPWARAGGLDVTEPPPAIGASLFVGGLVIVICTALLGAGVLRAGVYSRWVGWLLVASAVVSLASVALPEIVRVAGVVAAFTALGLVGLQLSSSTAGRVAADATAAQRQLA